MLRTSRRFARILPLSRIISHKAALTIPAVFPTQARLFSSTARHQKEEPLWQQRLINFLRQVAPRGDATTEARIAKERKYWEEKRKKGRSEESIRNRELFILSLAFTATAIIYSLTIYGLYRMVLTGRHWLQTLSMEKDEGRETVKVQTSDRAESDNGIEYEQQRQFQEWKKDREKEEAER